jgi:hypothetical protein
MGQRLAVNSFTVTAHHRYHDAFGPPWESRFLKPTEARYALRSLTSRTQIDNSWRGIARPLQVGCLEYNRFMHGSIRRVCVSPQLECKVADTVPPPDVPSCRWHHSRNGDWRCPQSDSTPRQRILDLPGDSGRGRRVDRPADGEALGRGRAVRCRRALRHFERGFRCGGSAAAVSALHAGQSACRDAELLRVRARAVSGPVRFS